jgi:hypothetical protein
MNRRDALKAVAALPAVAAGVGSLPVATTSRDCEGWMTPNAVRACEQMSPRTYMNIDVLVAIGTRPLPPCGGCLNIEVCCKVFMRSESPDEYLREMTERGYSMQVSAATISTEYEV